MAKPFGVEVGEKPPVTGAFTATGQSESFIPSPAKRRDNGAFNVALTGTGVATIELQKSFDGGTTWCDIYAGGAQLYTWSYSSSNLTEVAEECEAGVLYRLSCTAYTSGTISYRLSQ